MVAAVGMCADGQQRRRLDTLGDCHARIEPPPALEIGDKVRRRGEIRCDKPFLTANMCFECVFGIVFQNFLGCFIVLCKGAEEIVVIGIADGVTLALVHVLCIGQLRTRYDVDDALRDDLTPIGAVVQIAREVVDLILPQVGDCLEEARLIAVEGRVADGGLRLVRVAGKARTPCGGNGGEDTSTAVARLHILAHK